MFNIIKNIPKTRSKTPFRLFYTDFYNLINFEQSDFHKSDLKFDIDKLQKATSEVLKVHGNKFDDSLGVKNFAAIPLNKIPGNSESIKGHNVRGLYWTKPDSTGFEVTRDIEIEEELYTEIIPEIKHTYFNEVINKLRETYKIGRVRLLLKEPRSCLSYHRDPEPRLHIPIITNPGAQMIIEDSAKHMPADGSVWITNNKKYHNFVNGGEESRIHLVACILDYEFD